MFLSTGRSLVFAILSLGIIQLASGVIITDPAQLTASNFDYVIVGG